MGEGWSPLVHELALFIAPLAHGGGPTALGQRIGWDLDAATGLPIADIEAVVTAAGGVVDRLVTLSTADDPSLVDVVEALPAVADLVGAVRRLADDWHPPAQIPTEAMTAFVEDLLEHLLLDWLVTAHPRVVDALAVTGLYVPASRAPERPALTRSDGRVLRRAGRYPRLDTALLGDLLADPVAALRARYDAAAADLGQRLDLIAADLLPVLAEWLRGLGLDAAAALDDPDLLASLPADQRSLAGRLLRVGTTSSPYTGGQLEPSVDAYLDTVGPELTGSARAGAALVLTGEDSGHPAVVVEPFGALSGTWHLGAWTLTVDAAAVSPGLVVGTDGVRLADGTAVPDISVRLVLARTGPPPDPAGPATAPAPLALPAAGGTRVEVGAPSLTVSLTADAASAVVDVAVGSGPSVVVVEGGDGDSFLSSVLPEDGLRVPFDVAVGWNSAHGLRVTGGSRSSAGGKDSATGGLTSSLPVHRTIGPLTVETVDLALPTTPHGAAVAAASTFRLQLGPVVASVQRLGLQARASLPPGGGTLGPLDVDLAFRPPDGIALAVAAGPVTGGGYLFHDAAKQEYAGALQLDLEGIGLSALGLLTTRLPDGSPGFSLLLIISARFTPIQLSFGFTLNGVGGLVGINRTVDVDALRAGIRTGALDAVLFPQDPVARATELVTTLGTLFPAAAGRHVLGPMARIGWGTPTLLTLDIALLLEFPAPMRLSILGRLRMVLPTEEAAVVSLRLDVLGVVDFSRGEAAVDATLYDSRIAAFALSGDMAMRMRWLDRPAFALSAGGFNPRFTPPPGFPALRRLTLALASGDNPRLRLECYLALTSNTVQFGARLELYAAAFGFSVEGMLGFDALVVLEPFGFVVDIAGSLALKHGGDVLMAVRLDMTLSGPAPWHAQGRATFEILFFSAEISFDVRSGDPAQLTPPAPVDVVAVLEAALADPRSWSAQQPPAGGSVVSLREIQVPEGTLLAHPLGGLSVSQRAVPLGMALQRFGAAPVVAPGPFQITAISLDGDDLATEPLEEDFAAGQFLDLSDDEKLSRPSFERHGAGRRLAVPPLARARTGLLEAPLEYEEVLVGEPAPAPGVPTPRAARDATREGLAPWPGGVPAELLGWLPAADDGELPSLAVGVGDDGGPGPATLLGTAALLGRTAASPAARAVRTDPRRRFAGPPRSLTVADRADDIRRRAAATR